MRSIRSKVKVHVAYDGSSYYGWQRQKSPSLPTIQKTLEDSLSKIFDEPIQIYGAGRTDAGAHALMQVFHFSPSKDPEKYQLKKSLNGTTPSNISVHECWKAPERFHSLKSCLSKTYTYFVWNHAHPHALYHKRALWCSHLLDIKVLNEMSQALIKKQDFKSFQTQGSKTASTLREVFEASWSRPRPHLLKFEIRADGFLKQMVRNIVGTLIDLHKNNQGKQELIAILRKKDRKAAFSTARPEGLYLQKVFYPRELDNECYKI